MNWAMSKMLREDNKVDVEISDEKITDFFTSEELEFYCGLYNKRSVMFKQLKKNESLDKFSFYLELDEYNVLETYNVVNVKSDYLIVEKIDCTFHNLIKKHRSKFFELRKHKNVEYDMSPSLVRIMRTIVRTIKSLERCKFYIVKLDLKEVYFCINRGNVDDSVVKIFYGIRKRDLDTQTSHLALERMVADLFEVVDLQPSPLVIQLKDKLHNSAAWDNIMIHPAFLTTWEKIKLVNDASGDVNHSCLDNALFKMPSDPNLILLGVQKYGSVFSAFITFLRDRFRHYVDFERHTKAEKQKLIKEVGRDNLELALYVEKIMPKLWTTLTDVLEENRKG